MNLHRLKKCAGMTCIPGFAPLRRSKSLVLAMTPAIDGACLRESELAMAKFSVSYIFSVECEAIIEAESREQIDAPDRFVLIDNYMDVEARSTGDIDIKILGIEEVSSEPVDC